ncbi:MAG: SusD/RagB family nutrient-binding outer membrane lipoprotein, partial [Tannerella sp.]|nr:SusD/RagB family nutrient-binding outer membrane lipoprotein [Tannerella sp.]
MKKLIYNLFSFGAIALMLFASSCTDGFEELNTDPKNPVSTNAQYMFAGLLDQMNLYQGNYYYEYGIGYVAYLSQIWTIASDGRPESSFQMASVTRAADGTWQTYRNFIVNARYLESMLNESKESEETVKKQLAILKTLRAYLVFNMTDIYGDIPYSEAGMVYANPPIYRPKYDTQESIYKSLMVDLDDAIASLNAAGNGYGSGDILFQNDAAKWKTFANTLRLKYGLRMANADPAGAKAALTKVMASLDFLPAPAKGYNLAAFDIDAFTAGVNYGRGYMDGVSGDAGKMFYYNMASRIGTALWNQISDVAGAHDGSGFFDPRAFVFMDKAWKNYATRELQYNPLPQGFDQRSAAENGEAGWMDRGAGYKAYDNPRQENGEAGYYEKLEAGVASSPINYNFVRGSITNAPEVWISSAEVQSLLAEVYARSDLGFQDLAKAKDCYIASVITSVKFWYDYAYNQTTSSTALSIGWVDKPAKPTTTQINALLNNPKVNWDAATNKLGIIYTQRWVDYFQRPHEAFYLRLE